MSELRPFDSAASDALCVPNDRLRWRCDASDAGFETTADVKPLWGIVGQDLAIEALRFGLATEAPGQNVYVRGIAGTGRMTLLHRLLEEMRSCRGTAADRCYVHNFKATARPRLITLPTGQGESFRNAINSLVEYLRNDLPALAGSEIVRERRQGIERRNQEETRGVSEPFDRKLRENSLALVSVQQNNRRDAVIVPLVEGEPIALEKLLQEGKIDEEKAAEIRGRIATFSDEYEDIAVKIFDLQQKMRIELRDLFRSELVKALTGETRTITEKFPQEGVAKFLAELSEDAIDRQLNDGPRPGADLEHYRVNVVAGHEGEEPCPIVVENNPTVRNLVGGIDRPLIREPASGLLDEHLAIRGGALLRADNGYLVLDARDLLSEPGAWRALVRTLRSGELDLAPADAGGLFSAPAVKPDVIPINVKVILVGDPQIYYHLDAQDPDFPHLFKVLADFDTVIPRDAEGVKLYAGVLARVVRDEKLLPFHRDAVAALAEHGARVAGRQDQLTARFGRLADIAREAVFLAREAKVEVVAYDHVRDAIDRGKARGARPARRFRELIADGTIRIETSGALVGSVNGMAVTKAGPLTYGFPARISATIGPGTAGTINIEGAASLSGAIHTKGFYILGGLMRHLLRTDHPLAFSASIAFEQSYGGIDGDSASGAEACCMISALTDVPLRQDLAMTGAIDQHGHIQPIGAATEKIEGFFDACQDAGFTGTQGVIIPQSNVRDLMLRPDVVAACEAGQFRVHAVGTIHEALAIFTGVEAGKIDQDGNYPEGTLLALAVRRAYDYWKMAVARGRDEPKA